MKQIWPTYAYSPATNVLTLTGLNIDRDQLLLVTAADRGRIMYNFADSSVTASAFTSGANTALTLVATTAGLTTTAALVIYFDDQATSSTVTGTVELGPTSLNALESITVTMGQVTVTGGLTDVQLRASAVTVGGTVTVGNSLTISSLPAISGTVTAQTDLDTSTGQPCIVLGYGTPAGMSRVTHNNAFPVQILNTTGQITPVNPLPISGTVTIGAGTAQIGSVTASGTVTIGNNITLLGNQSSGMPASVLDGAGIPVYFRTSDQNPAGGNFPISGTVTIGNTVTIAGTVTANPTGTQTIAGSVTLGAGTAQIGSVTASISGTVPISISSVTVGNSVTIGSLPAISGTVTANTFALQGTAVTTSNFTSTTASTVLASFNATREVLTIFNEGAGNLHIAPGATCTTIAYQVRLSAGDYYEVPNHQTTITHSAVFATAGTARICEVS